MTTLLSLVVWMLLLLALGVRACVQYSGSLDDMAAISYRNNHARSLLPQAPPRKIAIDNVRIFDGYRIRKTSTVVIDGDKIAQDGTVATERIDGQGGVLLPGLIDSHTHPVTLEHLNLMTSNGVTTAFQMACISPEFCASLQNHNGLVNIHWGSSPATTPDSQVGGHLLNMTHDSSLLIQNTSDAARWFEKQLAGNPGYFKLIAANPGLSEEALANLVNYSHDAGRPVICHAADLESQLLAHKAGVDQIHHMPLDKPITTEFAQGVSKLGQIVAPTLYMMSRYAELFGANYNAARESLAIYHRSKVPILASTDSNNETVPVPFGSSMHTELRLMVEAGLSTVDALRSATILPAMHWNLNDRGVIAPGKRADLLLIGSNPLVNFTAIRDIKRIWIAGSEYKR